MLSSISDFRYVSVTGISGFLQSGSGLVDPLPVRTGCASSLPFDDDEDLDDYACADLRMIDPAWLLEAVQERESYLYDGAHAQVPSSILTAPHVMSAELLSVAKALETWARRWETEPYVDLFVKPEAEDQIPTEWTDVIAVTFSCQQELNDRTLSFSVSDFTTAVSQWSPTSDSDNEIYVSEGLDKILKRYALRDYLSVPRMLGVEPDDSDGEFSWKEVSGWKGYYPPIVRVSDVLALYSDLEKTRCAIINVVSPGSHETSYKSSTETLTRNINHHVSSDYSIIVHSVTMLSYEGCPSFSPGSDTVTTSSYGSSSAGTRAYNVVSSLDLLTWSSWMASASDTRGPAGANSSDTKTSVENRMKFGCLSQRTYVASNAYDMDPLLSTRTLRSVSSAKSSESITTVLSDDECCLTAPFTMDLTDRGYSFPLPSDRAGIEVESASVLLTSVAVKRDIKRVEDHNAGAYQTPTSNYSDAYDSKIDATCSVNVRMKRVTCTIRDGHILEFSIPDPDSIPDANGGKNISIELSEKGQAVSGSRIKSNPWVRTTNVSDDVRKAVVGIGPVFVKFKPKTLVGED